MSKSFRYPSYHTQAADNPMLLDERDRAIEDFLRLTERFVFSSIGDVVVATSPVGRVFDGGSTIVVYADLTAALTGDTTVSVTVNGSVVGTVTVLSGATSGTLTVTQVTKLGDILQVASTAVGTGSALATVSVGLRP